MTHCSLKLASVCLIAAPFLSLTAISAVPPENVVIIVADDLGVEQIGAYGVGADPPPTPNLNALAGMGQLFEDAWSNPVCSPTRGAIQSGRWAFQTGLGLAIDPGKDPQGLPQAEMLIPEMLALGGSPMTTGAFGKWHLSTLDELPDAPVDFGYGTVRGTPSNLSLAPDNYHSFRAMVDGGLQQIETYATTQVTDWALDWIGEQTGRYFAWVAFHAPHTPIHEPPAALHTQVLFDENGDRIRDLRLHHRAMVEALDTEIGRLIDGVDLSTTLVIFIGDNGTDCPFSVTPFDAQNCKGSVRPGGVWVPMIAAGGGVVAGQQDALVNVSDLFATVADIAGVDLAATFPDLELNSISIRPYLEDPNTPSQRQFNLTEFFRPNGFSPRTVDNWAARDEEGYILLEEDGLEYLVPPSDPIGNENLLEGELTPEQQAAYDRLLDWVESIGRTNNSR